MFPLMLFKKTINRCEEALKFTIYFPISSFCISFIEQATQMLCLSYLICENEVTTELISNIFCGN